MTIFLHSNGRVCSDDADAELCHKRGIGPLVSVLVPTRGRPAALLRCIDSLFSLAMDQRQIEVLLRVDDDDEPTLRCVKNLSKLPINVRAFVGPRGNGYRDLHHWYNRLASESTADWLFVLNDDATMATEKWDGWLAGVRPTNGPAMVGIAGLVAVVRNRPCSSEFMFVRRRVFELLGHLSLSPAVDTWLWSVMVMVGAAAWFDPVQVEHKNGEVKDATAAERQLRLEELGERHITGPAATFARMSDAMKLAAYIENELAKLTPWDATKMTMKTAE